MTYSNIKTLIVKKGSITGRAQLPPPASREACLTMSLEAEPPSAPRNCVAKLGIGTVPTQFYLQR